jgi:gas vesicle protein
MRDFSCNYKQVLRQAWSIKVTNSALEDLAQDFYIQVANYKLKNIEPYFTEEENTALYETKLKLAEHSEENNRLIQGLQKNIEDQGKKIEDLVREARDMASQMHELENLIENQCDKKSAYVKTLSELQGKVGDGSGIYESDLNIIQEKINDIDFTLKEMKNEYIDKVSFTQDIAYKIVKDSLFKCLSIKERHSKLLLGYISQNETEKQGILLQLSKKLSPISLS